MGDIKLIDNPNYDPEGFLAWMKGLMHVKTDAALAYRMNADPSTISRIRHRQDPIGPAMLVKFHELTDLPTKELKKHMGISQ
jgi:hypothetical protein